MIQVAKVNDIYLSQTDTDKGYRTGYSIISKVVFLLEVVHVGTDRRRTHLQVVVLAVGLRQVASHQSFSSIRVDVHEVSPHQVTVAHHHCQRPHTHIRCTSRKQYQSQKSSQSHHENLGSEPVQPNAGVVRVEQVRLLADGLALSSCIAVGHSTQIYIGIGICSGQVEQTRATTTGILATSVGSATASLGIALHNGWGTLKKSMMIPKRLKKALMKEPPPTLPQFLQRRRVKGLAQEVG